MNVSLEKMTKGRPCGRLEVLPCLSADVNLAIILPKCLCEFSQLWVCGRIEHDEYWHEATLATVGGEFQFFRPTTLT